MRSSRRFPRALRAMRHLAPTQTPATSPDASDTQGSDISARFTRPFALRALAPFDPTSPAPTVPTFTPNPQRLYRPIPTAPRAEDHLREHIEVIRSVTHNLEACLCLIDPSGPIAYVTPAFAALSGWAERVLLGSHVSAVFCQPGVACEPTVARGAPLPTPTLADVAAPFLSAFAIAAESHKPVADALIIGTPSPDSPPVDLLAFASAFLSSHEDDTPDVVLFDQAEPTPASQESPTGGASGVELAQ